MIPAYPSTDFCWPLFCATTPHLESTKAIDLVSQGLLDQAHSEIADRSKRPNCANRIKSSLLNGLFLVSLSIHQFLISRIQSWIPVHAHVMVESTSARQARIYERFWKCISTPNFSRVQQFLPSKSGKWRMSDKMTAFKRSITQASKMFSSFFSSLSSTTTSFCRSSFCLVQGQNPRTKKQHLHGKSVQRLKKC